MTAPLPRTRPSRLESSFPKLMWALRGSFSHQPRSEQAKPSPIDVHNSIPQRLPLSSFCYVTPSYKYFSPSVIISSFFSAFVLPATRWETRGDGLWKQQYPELCSCFIPIIWFGPGYVPCSTSAWIVRHHSHANSPMYISNSSSSFSTHAFATESTQVPNVLSVVDGIFSVLCSSALYAEHEYNAILSGIRTQACRNNSAKWTSECASHMTSAWFPKFHIFHIDLFFWVDQTPQRVGK